MNLQTLLLNALTSGGALSALAKKTGLSEKQLKMVLSMVIPLLLKKLTGNASSTAGAGSLLNALGQHRSSDPIEAQLAGADEEDGAKITKHILGDDQDDLIQNIAGEAGIPESAILSVLANISPSVMNGLSAAAEAKPVFGMDAGLVAGSGAGQEDHAINGTQLLGTLMTLMKQRK